MARTDPHAVLRLLLMAAALVLPCPSRAVAQTAARLSVLQAENRRAPTSQDVAVIRAGARSADAQTARIGLRALGRLERPALIPDILPGLKHSVPEVRAEAANAVAQAAQGVAQNGGAKAALASAQAALIVRLGVEAEASVRAAICESIGRLPYAAASDVARAESALLAFAARAASNVDRLGLAKGLEALARIQRAVSAPGQPVIDQLRALVLNTAARPDQNLLRDARVRRLALEALISLDAADAAVVLAAAADGDPQVRRLAMRAAIAQGTEAVATRGLHDPVAMVRIEALRTMRVRRSPDACNAALAAASDPDMNVTIVAIDQLGGCSDAPDAVTYLQQAVADPIDAEAPRNWHRTAKALAALATASPARAAGALDTYVRARAWQLRVYVARAAALAHQRELLEQLVRDSDDNVAEAAIAGLSSTVGHGADEQYIAALGRPGYQVVRAAALALHHSPDRGAAVAALELALRRVADDTRPGAANARSALRAALATLDAPARTSKASAQPAAPLGTSELRRLAAPRARFTVRDVGQFEIALLTMEAPATVLRFAQLAESGYYNGLAFRVVPNSVVQGGSPGANDYSDDASLMRDEVGLWPHVRGAVGISTGGRDTGDGQFFIDLVDNPRYDHTYTVFAQVLNGMEIVDRILEGDVIDTVEILP